MSEKNDFVVIEENKEFVILKDRALYQYLILSEREYMYYKRHPDVGYTMHSLEQVQQFLQMKMTEALVHGEYYATLAQSCHRQLLSLVESVTLGVDKNIN